LSYLLVNMSFCAAVFCMQFGISTKKLVKR